MNQDGNFDFSVYTFGALQGVIHKPGGHFCGKNCMVAWLQKMYFGVSIWAVRWRFFGIDVYLHVWKKVSPKNHMVGGGVG